MIYGVFTDSSRHTCVRVAVAKRFTSIIALEASSIHVTKVPNDTFAGKWSHEMPDYPVQRAAHNYLKSIAAAMEITPEARAYLELLQAAQTEEDFAQIPQQLPTIKERIMTEANTQTTEAKKPTTAPKAKAKPAAAKAKPAAAKAKPAAAKAKPAAGKKPAKAHAHARASDGPGRTSPYAGMTIKVLNKDVQAREGTLRHALRTAVIGCKTADDALAKSVNHEGEQTPVTGTVLTNMVKAGIISVK